MPFYAAQRVAFVTSVKEILYKVSLIHLGNQSQLYLYGNPSMDISDNKNIILSTIKVKKETHGFST